MITYNAAVSAYWELFVWAAAPLQQQQSQQLAPQAQQVQQSQQGRQSLLPAQPAHLEQQAQLT